VRSFWLLIIYVLFSFVKENEGKKETAERKEKRWMRNAKTVRKL
jgi:hypothetical protein